MYGIQLSIFTLLARKSKPAPGNETITAAFSSAFAIGTALMHLVSRTSLCKSGLDSLSGIIL